MDHRTGISIDIYITINRGNGENREILNLTIIDGLVTIFMNNSFMVYEAHLISFANLNTYFS